MSFPVPSPAAPSPVDASRPYYTVESARQFLLENDPAYRQIIAAHNAAHEALNGGDLAIRRQTIAANNESLSKGLEEIEKDALAVQEILKKLQPKPMTTGEIIFWWCFIASAIVICVTAAIKNGKLSFPVKRIT